MTKIQPPSASERTQHGADLEAAPKHDVAGHPATVGKPRIRFGYWGAAIVAGLAIWALIFALAF